MLPILLQVGPVKIYSMGVFLVIGIFLSLYWWWKMGRDEHLDEIELFDSYFLSFLVFGVVGRLTYVGMHWEELGTLYRALAVLTFPGISVLGGIGGALIFLILYVREHNWEIWKVLDSGVVAVCVALMFGAIGGLFNGSGDSRWVDIWFLVWATVMFVVTSRVRKNFRFYAWYKGQASVAREGLAALVYGSGAGVFYVGKGLLKIWGQVEWVSVLVGTAMACLGAYLIYGRIGRKTTLQNLLQWVGLRRS